MRKLFDPTEISSLFGETVSIRKVNGLLIIKNRPKRKRGKPSEKELSHRALIRAAAHYSKTLSRNQELKALYAMRKKSKHESAQSVAIADFLNPPTVDRIELDNQSETSRNVILISAHDNFEVVGVKVAISNGLGVVIEEGAAINNSEKNIDQWIYRAISVESLEGMKVTATAYDRPGNTGSAVQTF